MNLYMFFFFFFFFSITLFHQNRVYIYIYIFGRGELRGCWGEGSPCSGPHRHESRPGCGAGRGPPRLAELRAGEDQSGGGGGVPHPQRAAAGVCVPGREGGNGMLKGGVVSEFIVICANQDAFCFTCLI